MCCVGNVASEPLTRVRGRRRGRCVASGWLSGRRASSPVGPRLPSGVRIGPSDKRRPIRIGRPMSVDRIGLPDERRRIRTPHASEGPEARQACCVRNVVRATRVLAGRPPTAVGGSDRAVRQTSTHPDRAPDERRRIRTPHASEGPEARQAHCVGNVASEPLTRVRGRRRGRCVASGWLSGRRASSPVGPRLPSGVRIGPSDKRRPIRIGRPTSADRIGCPLSVDP
ncbi:MAG: hypothetical protein CHACPFDD_02052 [Phycisphaerae bacterium]|nr:hypothetical protein [Phycisphaerae bacterium]